MGHSSVNDKKFKLISGTILSRSWRNFYRGYPPRMGLHGWSHDFPQQIQMANGCCCSIHLELSTCWHSTVRKHFHFQTSLENPSIQTHLVLLCCTKRLCIFGPKGAIQIRYYYYYLLYDLHLCNAVWFCKRPEHMMETCCWTVSVIVVGDLSVIGVCSSWFDQSVVQGSPWLQQTWN